MNISIDNKFNKDFYDSSNKKHISFLFKNNINQITTIFDSNFSIVFFATYSSLIKKTFFTKNNILRLIFEGDKDKIIKYFSRDYEKMYFFNLMLSDFHEENLINNLYNNFHFTEDILSAKASLFYIARKNLILKLLKNMKNKKEFIVNYFNLSDNEKNIFDVFLRNAVRYDIKWAIIPKVDGNLKSFALKYNITQKRVALGYYSFEDEERTFLDSIIEKFLSGNM
ncbi:hypothetical protein [Marinitoga lauensis]|uniref:hypothetical protein n=1 Tax=Marinitoga lauensis TaxID=2201189 RepID=UPI001F1105E4|nr:hypothetical protein [Marinitoga lauensis]